MFIQNIGYVENTVVTCEYLPEKQYFDRLFQHPKEKQITGITEELPSVTKEVLMQAINKSTETTHDLNKLNSVGEYFR